MEPLVSIVIPVYRTEKYLAVCMDSVLHQTYQNLEILLVDDGSPDNCPQMCDDYAYKDRRVRVIHRKNGGLSAARNSGLDTATGSYVTFVDSDDCIAQDMVAHMVELAEAEQADLVKIGLVRCYDGKIQYSDQHGHSVLSGMQVLQTIYDVPPQIISACGKLFRRELFETVRFPEGRYYEDEYTTPKLYALAKRVILSQRVMYYYMQWDNDSIMRSNLTEKKVCDALDMTRERMTFFREIGLKRMVKKAVQDHYLKLCALEAATAQEAKLLSLRDKLGVQRRQFAKRHPITIIALKAKQGLSHLKHWLLNIIKRN